MLRQHSIIDVKDSGSLKLSVETLSELGITVFEGFNEREMCKTTYFIKTRYYCCSSLVGDRATKIIIFKYDDYNETTEEILHIHIPSGINGVEELNDIKAAIEEYELQFTHGCDKCKKPCHTDNLRYIGETGMAICENCFRDLYPDWV